MLKLQAGIHSLRNLFWLVKDTFLSEIVSNNNINPTWRVFEKVHQHNRIYHRGNLNVWWESYFYARKLLFAAIKEITNLFSTHWEKLWKSGEEDWQTVWLWPGIHRGEKPVEKHKEGFCLATKIRISFRDFQSFTGFFQKWRSLWGLFICCTEDHTCTVVNNGTCAVLSAHTANWRQKSFIQVFFVSASVLSMDRCYKLFLP